MSAKTSKAGRKANRTRLTDAFSDEDLVEYVNTVKSLVRYSEIVDLSIDEVSVSLFERLRLLALADVFTDWGPKERQELVDWSESSQANARQTLTYGAIKRRIHEIADQLAKNDGMMALAEHLEPVMAEKMLTVALSGHTRDAIGARKEFLDRMSAKKGREETISMRLPPELMELMAKSQDIEAKVVDDRALPPGELEDVIDASVIRRPDE